MFRFNCLCVCLAMDFTENRLGTSLLVRCHAYYPSGRCYRGTMVLANSDTQLQCSVLYTDTLTNEARSSGVTCHRVLDELSCVRVSPHHVHRGPVPLRGRQQWRHLAAALFVQSVAD